MLIFLDDIIFSLQTVGGISVYWAEFLNHINQSDLDVTLLKRTDNKCILSNKLRWHKKISWELKLPIKISRILPLLNILPSKSIYHSSYFRVSLQKNICNIVTLHDLAGEMGMITGWRRKFKIILQSAAIKKADGIICVSQTTLNSLLSYYPNINPLKTVVIYHGCSNSFFCNKNKTPTLKKQIIFIGGRKDYKNFDICLETIAQLPDFELLIIGGDNLQLNEIAIIQNKIGNRYSYIKEVKTEVLNQIYNNAYCLFYPTYYEGFGMPVVEAMKAGCVVISCATNAIVEVAGDAAILIEDPKNTKAFVEAILSLNDLEFKNALINKGLERAKRYNWDNHFNQTINFYKNMYKLKFG